MIVENKPSVKINDIAHRTGQTDENKEIFGDREKRLQLMRRMRVMKLQAYKMYIMTMFLLWTWSLWYLC